MLSQPSFSGRSRIARSCSALDHRVMCSVAWAGLSKSRPPMYHAIADLGIPQLKTCSSACISAAGHSHPGRGALFPARALRQLRSALNGPIGRNSLLDVPSIDFDHAIVLLDRDGLRTLKELSVLPFA